MEDIVNRIDETLAQSSDDAAAWTDTPQEPEHTGPDTVYATWLNITGELSLAAGIAEALGNEGADLDAATVEADYRRAIASALEDDGHGIRLVGDEFIGPAAARGDFDLDDLKETVAGVDFWEVVGRH